MFALTAQQLLQENMWMEVTDVNLVIPHAFAATEPVSVRAPRALVQIVFYYQMHALQVVVQESIQTVMFALPAWMDALLAQLVLIVHAQLPINHLSQVHAGALLELSMTVPLARLALQDAIPAQLRLLIVVPVKMMEKRHITNNLPQIHA